MWDIWFSLIYSQWLSYVHFNKLFYMQQILFMMMVYEISVIINPQNSLQNYILNVRYNDGLWHLFIYLED